ncbi:type VI secretion system accessory protein TagJ [Bordetella bronchiseptica]
MQTSVLAMPPRDGGLAGQAAAVQARIRRAPADADLRAQLFQLAAVQGDWRRAAEQLQLCAQLNPLAQPMANLYLAAIHGELRREAVLAGQAEPGFLAERPCWCEPLLQALRAQASDPERAAMLRAQAFDAAQASAGTLEDAAAGQAGYAWICDGDSRLGPVCELILDGSYAWLPFAQVAAVHLPAPQGLCDLVWARAEIALADGAVVRGLVPARYPPSAGQDDGLRLGRATCWRPLGQDGYAGEGQKMWLTDAGEFALLDVRALRRQAP